LNQKYEKFDHFDINTIVQGKLNVGKHKKFKSNINTKKLTLKKPYFDYKTEHGA